MCTGSIAFIGPEGTKERDERNIGAIRIIVGKVVSELDLLPTLHTIITGYLFAALHKIMGDIIQSRVIHLESRH